MSHNNIKAGDVLLYRKSGLIWKLIKFGEELEDGEQNKEYEHVAVAINDNKVIEANGHEVAVDSIDPEDDFDVYRVSDNAVSINDSLNQIRKYIGEKYDWMEIIDQGLRDISGGIIHISDEVIKEHEAHQKICSSLIEIYLDNLGFTIVAKDGGYASPEDIYVAVKDYMVTE